MSDWLIISDGSVGTSGEGGAACMVFDQERWIKLNAYFGPLLSSEAELLGGLLGLSYVFLRTSRSERTSIVWCCDCRTVLETANKRPSDASSARGGTMRSRRLWRLFYHFAGCFELECRYIIGASNVRQQACDRASRWARKKGLSLTAGEGEGPIGRLAEQRPELAWHFVDGRVLLELLAEQGAAAASAWLRPRLAPRAAFPF